MVIVVYAQKVIYCRCRGEKGSVETHPINYEVIR